MAGHPDPQLTEDPKGHLPGATTAPAGINGLKADEVTQKYGYYHDKQTLRFNKLLWD
jgi:hypothetical protein